VKVLLSAYSCDPLAGSEPGVGFQTLLAAASEHEVWLLSREKNIEAVGRFLGGHQEHGSIHLVPLDLGRRELSLKQRFSQVGMQWYYDRWQRAAADLGKRLHAEVGFDLVHHVTFSSDWTRPGVGAVDTPFVWGPIGGGVEAPPALVLSLGWKGAAIEVARRFGRGAMRLRPSYRTAWATADIVLVQNRETAALAPTAVRTDVLPHSTSIDLPVGPPPGPRTKEIAVVGRLIPWKGGMLALSAFRQVRDREASLTFFGSGPERRRLERACAKWRLTDRVRFEGSLARTDLLKRVARAGALVHAAVHDESPLSVAEALSLGTPVVCLDRGGPPELLRQWDRSPGIAVATGSPAATARRLAAEVDRFLSDPPPLPAAPLAPRRSYAEMILDIYKQAQGKRAQGV